MKRINRSFVLFLLICLLLNAYPNKAASLAPPSINSIKMQTSIRIESLDELESVISDLNGLSGGIIIPNGDNWLWEQVIKLSKSISKIILDAYKKQTSVQLNESAIKKMQEDLEILIYEPVFNSIAWVVKNKRSDIKLKWNVTGDILSIQVTDEGTEKFSLDSPSPKEKVYDASGENFIAGLGMGLSRLKKISDKITVIPIMEDGIQTGNALKLKINLAKYTLTEQDNLTTRAAIPRNQPGLSRSQ
ncbi:MAG: hypothetical protein ABII27_05245 [bacterium]